MGKGVRRRESAANNGQSQRLSHQAYEASAGGFGGSEEKLAFAVGLIGP
jgi:hypothetical protein